MAVYTAPVLSRPSGQIPVTVNLVGTGTQTLELPSFLVGRPWRVTSCDVTMGTATGISTCVIRLYGCVGVTASNDTTVTAQSRVLVINPSLQQLKLKNDRRVQHGTIASAGATIMDAQLGTGTNGTVLGVLFLSIIGAI